MSNLQLLGSFVLSLYAFTYTSVDEGCIWNVVNSCCWLGVARICWQPTVQADETWVINQKHIETILPTVGEHQWFRFVFQVLDIDDIPDWSCARARSIRAKPQSNERRRCLNISSIACTLSFLWEKKLSCKHVCHEYYIYCNMHNACIPKVRERKKIWLARDVVKFLCLKIMTIHVVIWIVKFKVHGQFICFRRIRNY